MIDEIDKTSGDKMVDFIMSKIPGAAARDLADDWPKLSAYLSEREALVSRDLGDVPGARDAWVRENQLEFRQDYLSVLKLHECCLCASSISGFRIFEVLPVLRNEMRSGLLHLLSPQFTPVPESVFPISVPLDPPGPLLSKNAGQSTLALPSGNQIRLFQPGEDLSIPAGQPVNIALASNDRKLADASRLSEDARAKVRDHLKGLIVLTFPIN